MENKRHPDVELNKPVNKKSRLFNFLTTTLTNTNNNANNKNLLNRNKIDETIRNKISTESLEIRQKLLLERKEKYEKIQLEKFNTRLNTIDQIVSLL